MIPLYFDYSQFNILISELNCFQVYCTIPDNNSTTLYRFMDFHSLASSPRVQQLESSVWRCGLTAAKTSGVDGGSSHARQRAVSSSSRRSPLRCSLTNSLAQTLSLPAQVSLDSFSFAHLHEHKTTGFAKTS